MKELIVISKAEIGGGEVNTVNARDLHAFLESKQEFASWIKNRIEQYGFVEGVDFIKFDSFIKSDSRARIEYALTIDMAKEISMVERNEKGKQARQYFIECERVVLDQAYKLPKKKPATLLPIDKEFRAAVRMAKAAGLKGNMAILSANQLAKQITGADCLELLGTTHLINETQERFLTPTEIGEIASLGSGREVNKMLASLGLQERAGKDWVPTATGQKFAVVMDTGKRRSSGAMVQQTKWKESVVKVLVSEATA
jgi:phage anti-repressor protein